VSGRQAAATASAAQAGRVLVVWNPSAGLRTGLQPGGSADELREILEQHSVLADIAEPTDEVEARAIVRHAVADDIDIVVAAGGDGTVHLVAEGLLGTTTALGILPLGRVMNIARALGIGRDLDEAAEILATGVIRDIDTGEAVTADGRVVPFLEAGSVGPYLGLGMTVAPDARLDDGRFDVTVFRNYSKWELLRHLASISFGRRRYAPKATTHRAAEVRISSVHPLPARADGADLGHTPVTYRTRPRALRVVVPREPQSTTESSTDGSVRRRM
jgi:diacylglycerol kinase family enzyme